MPEYFMIVIDQCGEIEKSSYFTYWNKVNYYGYIPYPINREPKGNEVFFTLMDECENYYIIPQKDFIRYFEKGSIKIYNAEISIMNRGRGKSARIRHRNDNNRTNRSNKIHKNNQRRIKKEDCGTIEWYHGAPYPFAVALLSKCNAYGDFGKGFYLTNDFSIAKGYALQKGTPRYQVYVYVWYNKDLENELNANRNKKDYITTLSDENGQVIKVKVFNTYCYEWAKWIIMGWTNPKRLKSYDMIVGPISQGSVESEAVKAVRLIKNGKDCESVINQFLVSIQPEENIQALQVCCKEQRVIDCFKRVGIRK